MSELYLGADKCKRFHSVSNGRKQMSDKSHDTKGAFVWDIPDYSGIYPGIYSGYSAPGSRMGGMEIQEFRNENSSQTNAYSHYSN